MVAEIAAADGATAVWLEQNREHLLEALRGEGLDLSGLDIAWARRRQATDMCGWPPTSC